MARFSREIHVIREAIHELKHLGGPVAAPDTTTVVALINIMVNALEAIERELSHDEEGR